MAASEALLRATSATASDAAAAESTPAPIIPASIIEAMPEANTAVTNTVATAQVMRPCAVSRKNTSWVCVPTHLVRSRPVRNAPIPELIHCTTINHIAVIAVKVPADTWV